MRTKYHPGQRSITGKRRDLLVAGPLWAIRAGCCAVPITPDTRMLISRTLGWEAAMITPDNPIWTLGERHP